MATHCDHGFAMTREWLRGCLLGLLGYIAFVACVGYTIERLGVAGAFGLGLGSAALTVALASPVTRRSTMPA